MTDYEKLAKQLLDDVLYLYYHRDSNDVRSFGEILDESLDAFNWNTADQIESSIYKELAGSFTKQIPSVVPTRPNLSDLLYNNGTYVEVEALLLLKNASYAGLTYKELSMQIYDGYNSGVDILDVIDELPKYVEDFLSYPPKHLDQFLESLDKLSTKPYKTAIAGIKKAMEKMDADALEQAMHIALEEKARYYANRIARTEIQRAKELANAKDMLGDKDIKLVKWELSSAHKIFDICDYYARLDVGYGAGIFPKGTSPHIPLHPHCMCKVIPHYHKIKKRRFKDPSKRLMDKLTPFQQKSIAGSWDKLDDYYSGTPLVDVFNKARPKYPIRSVADVLKGVPFMPPKGMPKRKPIPKKKPKPLFDPHKTSKTGLETKYDDIVAPLITKDAQKVMNNTIPLTKIVKAPAHKGYYDPAIYPTLDVNGKTTAGVIHTSKSDITILHEFGHHIDFVTKDTALKGIRTTVSDSKEWITARKADIDYINNMDKLKDFTTTQQMDWFADRWNVHPTTGGVSDIYDSLTLGVFKDNYHVYGHGSAYYNSTASPLRASVNIQLQQTEIFANLFEAWTKQGLGWDEAVKFYPNLTKLFEEEMKRIMGK